MSQHLTFWAFTKQSMVRATRQYLAPFTKSEETKELEKLIEATKDHVMTDEEREEQRRSDKAADALLVERDRIRTFTIRITVLAKDAARIDKQLEDFLLDQCDATPGYVSSISYKDEEV